MRNIVSFLPPPLGILMLLFSIVQLTHSPTPMIEEDVIQLRIKHKN